jgi:hypothetical protein
VQRICTKENLTSWLWTTVFLFFVVPNLHTDITHTVFTYTNYTHSQSCDFTSYKWRTSWRLVISSVHQKLKWFWRLFQVVTCSPCNITKSVICYCTSCIGHNVITQNHLTLLWSSSIVQVLCAAIEIGFSRRSSMPLLDYHLILYWTLPCKITNILL